MKINIADFRKKLLAINEIIYFDEYKYLREKASDPLKLRSLISEAEDFLKRSSEDHHYFLHGALGNLYRIDAQTKKAIDCLSYSLNLAVEERNFTREIVSLIRLGEAFKYDQQHHKALDLFNAALDKCEANNVNAYLDFALQHKGKCLLELARLDDAEECFVKALELRKEKREVSLIDSTEQALRLVKDMQPRRT
ncbi:hypothetical protein JNUCC1_02970 [Lentibacillus sp. JNUCC-1]|uniref:tetratricopeptide repeat protein n=1 Tax=Lentibacillus sp. JNUCC-1 TaxID=2654513 RepID=UPI0012E82C6D|nr:tetratricopeptide repeat protein [Lentibacillus sp. JNUCC-1]MUV39098.1 hypothetical protein [Lentibacillus sp. JNUCC-1]